MKLQGGPQPSSRLHSLGSWLGGRRAAQSWRRPRCSRRHRLEASPGGQPLEGEPLEGRLPSETLPAAAAAPQAARDEARPATPGAVPAEGQLSVARALHQTLPQVLAFAAPVLLIPLADPAMSLIDSVCIGRMANSLQLAALGPTSLLFNFSNYIWCVTLPRCVRAAQLRTTDPPCSTPCPAAPVQLHTQPSTLRD